jgi:yeast amino acid transporter
MYDSEDVEQYRSKYGTVEVTGSPAPDRRDDLDGDLVTKNEDRDLSRGLHQRHISLIAIAGAIGTGLFLGLGSSIQTAGPAGALLGYATVGGIVCCVQFALGEVTALLPVTGSFVRHAEFLVDPAMGFAIGWNIVCTDSLCCCRT